MKNTNFRPLCDWVNMGSSGVDSGGAGGDRAPPEFGGLEKRTEREIDHLLLEAPLDLKSYLRRYGRRLD